jgi:hypothetical protein
VTCRPNQLTLIATGPKEIDEVLYLFDLIGRQAADLFEQLGVRSW